MLEAVKMRLNRPIDVLLGGTHLIEKEGGEFESSLDYLRTLGTGILGLSHCTGKNALERLRSENVSFSHNTTGSSLFLP